jgi:uncharacterized protein
MLGGCFFTLGLLTGIQPAEAGVLSPISYRALAVGSVKPQGWLQRELRLQADGLSGYMPDFYDPVNNSVWIGGNSREVDWVEAFPYFLQGFVLQAILLNDSVQIASSQHYLDLILANQSAYGDGWLGPPPGATHLNTSGMDYWPRWPVCWALFTWYEYTGDARYVAAAWAWTQRAAAYVAAGWPWLGYDWTGLRLADWLLVNQYMIDAAEAGNGTWPLPASVVPFLVAFNDELQNASDRIVGGGGYEAYYFVDPAAGGGFPDAAVPTNHCTLLNHGVNNAMATKSGATLFRSGNPTGAASSYTRLALFDRFHGMPSGVFSADEHLGGTMPSRGTETCAVVEWIFSMTVMHETLGDAVFAERAERVAYNALPGALTKDLWARAYLQQPNEPVAVPQDPHVWASDGANGTIYSLAGNFACCTVNFNQGWGRFIARSAHATPAGGLALSMLAPVVVRASGGSGSGSGGGVIVSVATEYPFGDTVNVTLSGLAGKAFPLEIRIPAWAGGAELSVNGAPPTPVGSDFAGAMYALAVPPAAPGSDSASLQLALNPAIRVDFWYNGSIAVHRGALLFAVQLEEMFVTTEAYYTSASGGTSADYNVTQPSNTSRPWNVALVLDPASPEASLTFERVGPVPEVPYSSTEVSGVIRATGRVVNAWGFAPDGSAAPPPASPVDCSAPGSCGPEIAVTLVPFGSTHLRMTEVPYTLPS